MIKISKELLSEVLDCSIDNYTIAKSTEITQIRVWKKDAEMWDYRSYDIYHLAHKCKEWALELGYRIIIDSSKDIKASIRILQNGKDIYQNENKQETQAIVKACEWILKELKK